MPSARDARFKPTIFAALVASVIVGCRGSPTIVVENRTGRDLKVQARVPVHQFRLVGGRFKGDYDFFTRVPRGFWLRESIIKSGAAWNAAEFFPNQQFRDEWDDRDGQIQITLRDASLVNPRFEPLIVRGQAEPKVSYLALAQTVNGTVHLLLFDASGKELDRASTPMRPESLPSDPD
jgi:hypothetical protein